MEELMLALTREKELLQNTIESLKLSFNYELTEKNNLLNEQIARNNQWAELHLKLEEELNLERLIKDMARMSVNDCPPREKDTSPTRGR